MLEAILTSEKPDVLITFFHFFFFVLGFLRRGNLHEIQKDWDNRIKIRIFPTKHNRLKT